MVNLREYKKRGVLDGTGGQFAFFVNRSSSVCKKVKLPIIAKETGAGISREAAKSLIKSGVSAIDVGGAGGTSWSAVEILRGRANKESSIAFWDWGIPTAASILEIRDASKTIPLVASGGLRNGLEAAKCIALGADMVGMAYPFFKAAENGVDAVVRTIEEVGEGIRSKSEVRTIKPEEQGDWDRSLSYAVTYAREKVETERQQAEVLPQSLNTALKIAEEVNSQPNLEVVPEQQPPAISPLRPAPPRFGGQLPPSE